MLGVVRLRLVRFFSSGLTLLSHSFVPSILALMCGELCGGFSSFHLLLGHALQVGLIFGGRSPSLSLVTLVPIPAGIATL